MSEFEGDSPGFEVESIEGSGSGESSREISRVADQLSQTLIDDLGERGAREQILNIPVLTQEYGTDCGIACARMAVVHFGEEDPGTDGLSQKAEKAGFPFRMIRDAKGGKGPSADPAQLADILRDEYAIKRETKHTSPEEKASAIVQALKAGDPVQLSIFYHDLHPEDTSEMNRNHAVLVKGYRVKEGGEFVLVANDPKPEVGGETEIGKDLLERVLEGPVYVYSKK